RHPRAGACAVSARGAREARPDRPLAARAVAGRALRNVRYRKESARTPRSAGRAMRPRPWYEPRMPVVRALLSVSDKTGIIDFARGLSGLGIELLSTGGTASVLSCEGVKVEEVQDFTGAPEMLGGRVKTLHPKIHGGILARRVVSADQADMKAQGVMPFDLVVVNLYPFREAV